MAFEWFVSHPAGNRKVHCPVFSELRLFFLLYDVTTLANFAVVKKPDKWVE